MAMAIKDERQSQWLSRLKPVPRLLFLTLFKGKLLDHVFITICLLGHFHFSLSNKESPSKVLFIYSAGLRVPLS